MEKKCPNCANGSGIKVRIMEHMAHYTCPKCGLICSQLDNWFGNKRAKPMPAPDRKREQLVLTEPNRNVKGKRK